MKAPKQTKQLLAVSVSTSLINAVDQVALLLISESRSEVVRQALLAALEKEGVVPLNQVAA